MAFTMKKRYPRATRFRKIMSNNLSVQQTRRDPLATPATDPPVVISPDVTFTLNKPVIIASNAVDITGVTDNNGHKPSSITSAAPNVVTFHFPSGTVTSLNMPFEDPAVRGQVGEYFAPGNYAPSE